MRNLIIFGILISLGCGACLSAGEAAADTSSAPDAEALFQQGQAFESAGKFQGALAPYQQALEADPDLGKAERELGRCYYELGWKEEALKHYRAYADSADGAKDPQAKSFVDNILDQGQQLGALQGQLLSSGPWSADAALGYAWGFNVANFGRRYTASIAGVNNATPFNYSYNEGEGIAPQLGIEYRFHPNASIGMLVQPIFTGTDGHETLYEGITTTADETRISQQTWPIFLQLSTHADFSPAISVSSFFGVGAALPTSYTENTTAVKNDSTGLSTTTIHYVRQLSAATAFRAGLGAHAKLTPHLTLFMNAAFLMASLAPISSSYDASTTDQGGNLTTVHVVNGYSSNPPPQSDATPVSSTANPGPNRTFTVVYDDGQTQFTKNSYFNAGNNYLTTLDETNTLPLSGNPDNIVFKQLSATLGLRWDF